MRYVKTLAKASSGMSLKAEHSGRVMMTLESSPRPPGGKKRYKQLITNMARYVLECKTSLKALVRIGQRSNQK